MTEPPSSADSTDERGSPSADGLIERLSRPRFAVVVLVAAALRFYGLAAESLWTDELITWRFIRQYSALELVYVIPTHQPHLPLYYVLLDLWTGVAGTGEVALRLPAALFGIASVALCYLLAARLFDRNAGLVAGLLLATSSFHVGHSQEVRMYTLFTLLVLASTLYYVRLRETPTNRRAATYVAVTLALVFTHPFAVFVPLGQAAFHVADEIRSAEGARPVRLAMIGTWLVAGPVLAALVWKLSGTRFHYIAPPTPRHVLNTVATILGFGGLTTLTVALGLALAGGFAAAAVLREWTTPGARPGFDDRFGPATLVAAVAAAPLLANLLVSVALTPMFWPRYVIAAAPPLFVLVGAGASVAAGSARGFSRPLRETEATDARNRIVRTGGTVLAVAVILALLAVPLVDAQTTTNREQWREAGAVVERNARPGDTVLVADAISVEGMQYYVDRRSVPVKGVVVGESGTGGEADTAAEIRSKADGADRVWLAVSHASDSEHRRVVRALEADRTRVEHWSFVDVDLYLFERADPPSESITTAENDSRDADTDR